MAFSLKYFAEIFFRLLMYFLRENKFFGNNNCYRQKLCRSSNVTNICIKLFIITKTNEEKLTTLINIKNLLRNSDS